MTETGRLVRRYDWTTRVFGPRARPRTVWATTGCTDGERNRATMPQTHRPVGNGSN
ncbi:hypothetical protein ACIOC2_25020 [Streptomyces sp. NPDC088337]|uniref:hypothetical protein n=1 Tax=unclassified Streptomyces TaxID=2593676 RepID=UPI002DD95483|nr:hypothetical protein [Streptomyces sp. NBC_01788]WSB25197.1 hypothetical protein OIE49_04485 [Streptomyces sp. NBC_01788]